ncbi:MAG: ABC transporter permease [Bacteroidaceae bacterium]|nr:ABC transporter permease [Bacteroidaceae bacterium]
MLNDIKNIFKDPAAVLIMLLLPLVYPLLYSFIYTNEVVRDMPVCVVDMSDTQESRAFTRQLDATPDVAVAYRVRDFQEAQRLMRRQKVHGVLYFPADYTQKMQRLEQSPVEVYLDMGFMLYYKAFYLAVYNVMLSQKHPLLANSSDAIKVHDVSMFNTTGGYGNFLLPAVLVLILQQTLLLGMATQIGTRRQRGERELTIPERVRQAASYFVVYFLLAGYVLVLVPRIFGFSQMMSVGGLLFFLFPMLLSMVTFAVFVSQFFRHRETPLLYIAFTSVILLFLTGITWPESSMPRFWEIFAWLFPGTPAVRGFVRMNCMGATLPMVGSYVWVMLLQSVCYVVLALMAQRWYAGNRIG